MCGIGGIVRMGSKGIEEDQIASLLLALEHRGKDASGIALVNSSSPEDIHVCKDAFSATRFLEQTKTKSFLKQRLARDTKIVLVHTRAWTTGSPNDNKNNHPLFCDNSVITHNGIIWNHEELFKEMNLKRNAETDSDILRAIADEKGISRKAVRAFSKVSGSVAAAIINKTDPESVLLLRSGSPLICGANKDYIIWGSTEKSVAVAFRVWRKKFGIWVHRTPKDMFFNSVPADTAWFIDGKKGLTWHQEFKTQQYVSNYTFGHGAYQRYNYNGWMPFGMDDDEGCSSKVIKIEDGTEVDRSTAATVKRMIYCKKCGEYRRVLKDSYYKPKSELECKQCGSNLAEAHEYFSADN